MHQTDDFAAAFTEQSVCSENLILDGMHDVFSRCAVDTSHCNESSFAMDIE